jgi:CRP-like cAMP-binding protein/phosphoribosyl 1,2-cyclic phosphodiesterase
MVESKAIELSRGGYLLDTPQGYIQFGSPPETIKDTMSMEKGVPQIFVLPDKFFNWIKGISVAELEFPLYYNFFLKQRPTYIICSEKQFHRFKHVLRESVFGPKVLNLKEDYETDDPEDVANLSAEMSYFRNGFKLPDLVRFGIFKNNQFTIKGITIEKGEDEFRVSMGDEFLGSVPSKIDYKPVFELGSKLSDPFFPPNFGITCLGPSHGFDPDDNTSGYIIWLNERGIMVDPPVNSTEWLTESNVNPKYIDSIILTHCHADHDAGTFQKILEEGKITVYTTKTIMDSFLLKYSTFAGVSKEYLLRLFNFVQVKVGRPFFLYNGKFEVFYTLHSIPTIGFKVNFQGKTFAYSSDHNNDPIVHDKMLDEGVITKHRYVELRNFPWDADIIYHESGIAPLHTPINYLNSLPEDVQKRVTVYHISKKDFPKETSLKLATFGIENTHYFNVQKSGFEETYNMLKLLDHIDFYRQLPISKAEEFIRILKLEKFKKGDIIIQKGSKGDKFYIIMHGYVYVEDEDLKARKIYGSFDYFGEVALIQKSKRQASIIAETDVDIYTIRRDEFLQFIQGTEFEETLKRLAVIRNADTWNLLSESSSLQFLTSTQKTILESMFHPIEFGEGKVIQKSNTELERIYIIKEGTVQVLKDSLPVAVLSKGDFIGQMHRIHKGEKSEFEFIATSDVKCYYLTKDRVEFYIENNPGVIMKLRYSFDGDD